jgi:hypothetical protein
MCPGIGKNMFRPFCDVDSAGVPQPFIGNDDIHSAVVIDITDIIMFTATGFSSVPGPVSGVEGVFALFPDIDITAYTA